MDVYVARQAIFNEKTQVIGYELLFRDSTVNRFMSIYSSNSTLTLIKNSFSIIGIDKLIEGKKAFINFDEALLKSGIVETMPKDLVVVEILETVNPDEKIIEMCKKLKEKGYTLALDDFQYNEKYIELFKIADIIKVDFLATKGLERKAIIEKINNSKIKFLAEKVETEEDYKLAISYGYSLFQGYFFCKPSIISGKDISTYKFTYIKLIRELNKKSANLNTVETFIKNDVSLSYKLLKLANSAHFSCKSKITSIKDAIVLLGVTELKKWLFIITLKSINENKPDEIIKMSLIRASFGEVLTRKIDMNLDHFDMFLTGLLSMIDTLLSRPLIEILNELPVSQSVKDALAGKVNILLTVLDLIKEYEKANWDGVSYLIEKMGLDEKYVSNSYCEAVEAIENLNIL